MEGSGVQNHSPGLQRGADQWGLTSFKGLGLEQRDFYLQRGCLVHEHFSCVEGWGGRAGIDFDCGR